MSENQQLKQVLQEWSELFMHRSFCEFKEFMDDSGLSTSQVIALMRLYHGGVCGVSGIAGHLGVTAAAASQLVDRLVQQDLLERTEDAHDRRARYLTLTPKAQALIEAGIDARRRWLEELTMALPLEEQEKIIDVLKLLNEIGQKVEQR